MRSTLLYFFSLAIGVLLSGFASGQQNQFYVPDHCLSETDHANSYFADAAQEVLPIQVSPKSTDANRANDLKAPAVHRPMDVEAAPLASRISSVFGIGNAARRVATIKDKTSKTIKSTAQSLRLPNQVSRFEDSFSLRGDTMPPASNVVRLAGQRNFIEDNSGHSGRGQSSILIQSNNQRPELNPATTRLMPSFNAKPVCSDNVSIVMPTPSAPAPWKATAEYTYIPHASSNNPRGALSSTESVYAKTMPLEYTADRSTNMSGFDSSNCCDEWADICHCDKTPYEYPCKLRQNRRGKCDCSSKSCRGIGRKGRRGGDKACSSNCSSGGCNCGKSDCGRGRRATCGNDDCTECGTSQASTRQAQCECGKGNCKGGCNKKRRIRLRLPFHYD